MSEWSAVFVLVERELRRYWRSKSRLISSIIQPLLYMTALGGGISSAVVLKGFPGSYLEFMAPGIVAMTVVTTSLFLGVSVIWDKTFGFMKEIMVAPVSRVAIALGKSIGGSVISTINGLIVLIIAAALGVLPLHPGVLLLIAGMFASGIIFSSLGISMASVIEDMNAFQLLSNILFMPMVFLSGVFYPLSTAPDALKIVACINPMSYPVDFLRGSLTGVFYINPLIDVGVMAGLIVAFLFLAAWLFSHTKVQI